MLRITTSRIFLVVLCTALASSIFLLAIAAGGLASAAGVKLDVRAATLSKTGDTKWEGTARSKQLGKGKLTLTGEVTFPKGDKPTRSKLRFRVTFKKGFLSGCFRNTIFKRPGNRLVWDGPGQVTGSSSSLRRYRGLKVHDDGKTKPDDLTHSKPFAFRTGGGPGTRC
jgi:hypothetical protein